MEQVKKVKDEESKISQEQESQEIVTNVQEKTVAMTANQLKSTFETDFASAAQSLYINSLDKELVFNEVSVKDQKTLARVMAMNETRKDVVYDAQCALINKVCGDKTFDVFKVSEFDRLKILMFIYQANMFQNDVKFTCEHCGQENSYKIDFNNAIHRLDDFDLDPKIFDYENRRFKFKFTLQFPLVSTVSAFYKSYCQKHKGAPRKMLQADEQMQNMEYVNLFIQKVSYESLDGKIKRDIDFSDYKVGDLEDIISGFPQDVLYADNGVMKFIVNEFISKLNATFDKHTCWKCGEVHEKGDIGNAESFF